MRSETAFRFIDEAKQRFALQGKRNSVALYRRSETAWRFTGEAKQRGVLQMKRNGVSLYRGSETAWRFTSLNLREPFEVRAITQDSESFYFS